MNEKTKWKLEFMVNVAFAAVAVALGLLALKAVGYLMPLALAFVLVMMLNPLVRFVHKKLNINRKLVSVVVMALLYVAVGWGIFTGVAFLVTWFRDLFIQLPGYYNETLSPALWEALSTLEEWSADLFPSFGLELTSMRDSIVNSVTDLLMTVSSRGISLVTDFTAAIPSFVIALTFTILLSFFISLQYDEVMIFIRNQVPEKLDEKMKETVALFKGTMLKYLRALGILMICTFVELSVGFFVIGVSNPIGKAAGIAVFDALPVFGTGGIVIPWIIIELLRQNFRFALNLTVLYIAVTVIRNVLEPKIVSDQLGLNPIISVASVYLGYRLVGVAGMILFPMVAQVLVALHNNGTIRLYREKKE